jgi:hypothetical protein
MPKTPQQYTDAEAERRATDALRRALTTPYKPQREMIGKKDRPSPKQKQAASKNHPKKP